MTERARAMALWAAALLLALACVAERACAGKKDDDDDEQGYGYSFSDNDQEAAFRLLRALDQRFEQSGVGGLEPERELVAKLLDTSTRLSGHRGEPGSSATGRDLVSGLPVRQPK